MIPRSIHDFASPEELREVMGALEREDPAAYRALMSDWRFTAPRFEDVALRCVLGSGGPEGVPGYAHDYEPAWWTRVVCEAFDSVWDHVEGRGGVGKLAVVLPLQHGKSLHGELLASTLLGRRPTLRGGLFGYKQDFGRRAMRHVKALMRSPGYQSIFPGVLPGGWTGMTPEERRRLADALPSGADFFAASYRRPDGSPTTGGYLLAGSWPTPPNGWAFDFLILDDPYRRWKDVFSAPYEKDLRDAYTGTLEPRLQGRRSVQVLCFTPWTRTDVASFILDLWRRSGDPFEVIRLPALPRPDTPEEVELGGRAYDRRSVPAAGRVLDDPQRDRGRDDQPEGEDRAGERVDGDRGEQEGEQHAADGAPPEPLCPGPWGADVRGLEWYERKRRSRSEREWNAHYMLDVSGSDYELLRREWWRWYDEAPADLFDLVFLSLDANAAGMDGGSEGDSFALAGAWGARVLPAPDEVSRTTLHRLGEYRARPGYDGLVDGLIEFAGRYPAATAFVVELAAAGRQLVGTRRFVEAMRARGIRVLHTSDPAAMMAPTWLSTPKAERQALAIPYVRAGRVLLPRAAPWVQTRRDPGLPWDEALGYLDECALGVEPDDRRDELAQAIAFAEGFAVPRAPLRRAGGMRAALRRR